MKLFLYLLVVWWALVNLGGVASHGVHPLSRIAIEKATVALDIKAYVKAHPTVLGSKVSCRFMGLRFPSFSLSTSTQNWMV